MNCDAIAMILYFSVAAVFACDYSPCMHGWYMLVSEWPVAYARTPHVLESNLYFLFLLLLCFAILLHFICIGRALEIVRPLYS